MSGVLKYTITVESDTPPQIMLGQNIFGGKVTGLEMESVPKLVSVSWLMERFGLSRANVIEKLRGQNKGSDGKHLYDSGAAIAILSQQKIKRGPKRIN